jgi:monofunctional chorismate mutase
MVDPANPVSKLRDLRDSIDNIDAAIVHMFAERFRCTHTVGKLKAQHGLPSRDPGREPSSSVVCGISRRSANLTFRPPPSDPLDLADSLPQTAAEQGAQCDTIGVTHRVGDRVDARVARLE